MKRLTCFVLSLAALVVLAVGWYSVSAQGVVYDLAERAVVVTLVVLAGQAVGWLVLRREPHRWLGPCIQVVAIVGPVAVARQADLGRLVPIVATLWLATILVPALLVVSVPDRVPARYPHWTLAVGMLAAAVLSIPIVDSAGGRSQASITWWHTNAFAPVDEGARRLFAIHTAIVAITLGTVAFAVIRRQRQTPPAVRSLRRPVVVAGLAWIAVTVAAEVAASVDPGWARNEDVTGFTPQASILLEIAPLLAITALLAAVGWVELIAPRLRRTASGVLCGDGRSADVTTYLARTLADPSVHVLFWSVDDQTWRDERGRAISLPIDDVERAITVVSRQGAPIAAFVHDAAWASQPELLGLVATTAGLALESDRLTSVANARVEDARRLAGRLVSAADIARDEVRRELTSGPLHELRASADAHADDTAPVADRLQQVAADVRRISHGVFPAVLTEQGLRAALTEAAAVPSRRFAASIEVTAYLAAVGDSSAVVVDRGNELVIELSRPPTTATVIDRVAVLGGSVDGATITVPLAPPASRIAAYVTPQLDLVGEPLT